MGPSWPERRGSEMYYTSLLAGRYVIYGFPRSVTDPDFCPREIPSIVGIVSRNFRCRVYRFIYTIALRLLVRLLEQRRGYLNRPRH